MTPPTGDPALVPATDRPSVAERQVRMRPATEQDLPRLARLDEQIFKEFTYPFFVLRQLMDVCGDDLLVLDDGTELLGYVLTGTRPDRKRSWILGLGVDERLRGRGMGRRLMEAALELMRAEGVVEAALTVDPENAPARALYNAFGFVQVDDRRDYFGPGQHRLIMVRPL
ncbi:GNAT family N-acetyltransferase [Streptomyces sp. NPDC001984]|uniref:GNAT family N-acetyltransferase n=1 Tax=Streptomyces sp. NPDC002619 TaxID=3364655 RepID=UPI0036785985